MSKTCPSHKANKTWPMVRLGDVCEISAGDSAPQDKHLYENGKYPFIRTSDVGDIHFGEINDSRDHLNEEGVKKLRVFPKGSILFPKSGASTFLNHRVMLGMDARVVSHLAVIMPGAKLDPRFLLHLLFTVDAKVLMQDSGYPSLRAADIAKIELLLPPLAVQREIVARLERELAAVDKMAKGFEVMKVEADQLFKSTLKETFEDIQRRGAETRRLGEVLDTGAGGTPLKQHRDYYDGGDIPWLRSGEVCKKDITETELFITAKGMENSSAKLFPKDSVVVAMYGATAGQVGILRIESTTNQAVCAIFPSSKHDSEFLYYQLMGMKDEMVSQAQGGAQPNISQIKIKNLKICLPPLTIQREVVAKLDAMREKCEKLKSAAEDGLKTAALMRKAILKEAFE